MTGLLLLSAGIDSPVAAHVMQQHMELAAVHFHSYPISDKATIEKSVELCKILGIKKLFIVPFAEVQTEVVKRCKHKYYFVITRRLMFKIAEEIAKKHGYDCLITGENLGQVASQTLDNLTVIDKFLELPVHRPILGNNKVDTIEQAKKIGTFDISKGPEVCCLLGPKNPVTKARLPQVEYEEKNLEITTLISKTIEAMEIA